ncbi:MAG: hypothetical protein ABF264_09605 [Flavobacteriales bacterium]
MSSLILYSTLVLAMIILYRLKKDVWNVILFEFSVVPLVFLYPGILSLYFLKNLNLLLSSFLAISLLLPILFIFLLSKKRMAINGTIKCNDCKQYLPKMKDVKLFDKRTLGLNRCEHCKG